MRRNFLMLGQSNMSGRGLVSEVPAYTNASRIFMFANDYTWKAGAESVDNPANQVDICSKDTNAGAGMGMAFANRLCTLFPSDEVGLIPCAMGSTGIRQWRRLWTRNNLYGSALSRAEAAKGSGTLAGILWWQGEAETLDINQVNTWSETFANIIANLRVDLGNLNLPVAFAQLNTLQHPRHKYWQHMRKAQSTIYGRNLVRIDTDGATFQSDNVHCTTAGYQTVGVRFADGIYPLL